MRICGRFGTFSYSKSQAPGVIASVHLTKETHHRKISFLERSTKSFLKKFEVPYDERYIFKAPE